jgi:hypothetical protein
VIPHRRPGLLVALVAAAALACGPSEPSTDYRAYTDDFAFRISTSPMPPHAREKTRYKIVVRDKKTGQPIEGGEGRVFASTREGAQTWDSFTPGRELGTYYATLNFIAAENWAVALQFRRDSTQRLERADWMQEVLPERAATP